MPDRATLERDLRWLGAETAWPDAPDLAPAVIGRLAAEAPGPDRFMRVRALRPLALALLALLLLAGTVMAASPSARNAVLDLFGLEGATVERRERLPERLHRDAGPVPGERVTLAQARRAVDFPCWCRRRLDPDRTLLRRDVPGGEVELIFHSPPRLRLTPGRLARGRS